MDIKKMMTNGIFTMNDKHTQETLGAQGKVDNAFYVENLRLVGSISSSLCSYNNTGGTWQSGLSFELCH